MSEIRAVLGAVLLCLAGLAGPAAAADHAVAATGTATTGSADGSPARPWPSVQAALESGALRGGDRLLLAPGRHGRLLVRRAEFDPPLTIASAPGGRAHVDQIEVRRSSGLAFRDLDVWPVPEPGQKRLRGAAVGTDRGSSGIVFDGLDIRSAADATDWRDWDHETWMARRRLGVGLSSADSVLSGSTITGVSGGVNVVGAGSTVTGNEIVGFAKDGMRVFGRDSVIRGNTIRDCVKLDKNHDDGIQSWVGQRNPDGAVIGIRIIGNRILEWTGAPDHPLRCGLQGIGLFDGPYRDWVIENNLIVVRAHHGIAMYDMHGARVLNNTVVHVLGKTGKNPWIRLDKTSRDGSNLVANNVAMGLILGEDGVQNNLKVVHPHALFEDPARFDYRPRADSPLIGTADPALAPATDIDGRPRGGAPDLGAFQRP